MRNMRVSLTDQIRTKAIGDNVHFGRKNKVSPNVWTLAEKSENSALLIWNGMEIISKYHNHSQGCKWSECNLRQYLNSDFLNNTFEDDEKKLILPSKIVNQNTFFGYDCESNVAVSNSLGGITHLVGSVSGGVDTIDYVFILSICEAERYKKYLPIGKGCKYSIGLRSSGKENHHHTLIDDTGFLVSDSHFHKCRIVPALKVSCR